MRAGRRTAGVPSARRATLAAAALAAVPAAALGASATASVEVSAGALAVSAPEAVDLPPVRLAGRPVTVEASLGPIVVTDTRGQDPGWTLVAAAGPLTGPLGTRLGAIPEIVPPAAAGGPAGLSTGAPAPLDAPALVAQARAGSGRGTVSLVPVLRLTIPPDTASARYSGRLVLTLS